MKKVWVLLHDNSDAILGIFDNKDAVESVFKHGLYSEPLAIEEWPVFSTDKDFWDNEIQDRLRYGLDN